MICLEIMFKCILAPQESAGRTKKQVGRGAANVFIFIFILFFIFLSGVNSDDENIEGL